MCMKCTTIAWNLFVSIHDKHSYTVDTSKCITSIAIAHYSGWIISNKKLLNGFIMDFCFRLHQCLWMCVRACACACAVDVDHKSFCLFLHILYSDWIFCGRLNSFIISFCIIFSVGNRFSFWLWFPLENSLLIVCVTNECNHLFVFYLMRNRNCNASSAIQMWSMRWLWCWFYVIFVFFFFLHDKSYYMLYIQSNWIEESNICFCWINALKFNLAFYIWVVNPLDFFLFHFFWS